MAATIMLLVASASALAPPAVNLGDFVLQRAIQTQLHYSAGLRNEPQVGWMAKFEGHEHLDSVGRHVGASGFPGTYTAAFGQLRTTPYTAYLAALGEEPDGIVETAFDCGYLRREAAADAYEDEVDARITERREARRAKREAGFVDGDEEAKATAARAAALQFLDEFCDEWVPRLTAGDVRSALEKRASKPPPGMREARSKDAGADADVVFEALWDYRDESPYMIRGGELVSPAKMGVRLGSRVLAAAAQSSDASPRLRAARTKYPEEDRPLGAGQLSLMDAAQARVDRASRPTMDALESKRGGAAPPTSKWAAQVDPASGNTYYYGDARDVQVWPPEKAMA
ncbi:hypothetical protein JL721_12714 [Aureococcus anophagefferens]|nr:hypothetical protein JL721_12714 [Aureococcus anophagefferens]